MKKIINKHSPSCFPSLKYYFFLGRKLSLIFLLLLSVTVYGQQFEEKSLLSKDDFIFLESLTKAVMDSSRIYPQQKIASDFGGNNTGGVLIRPGGRSSYPAFWIRDYSMSLESGFVKMSEQKHMLLLTASTQCDQTWITKGGSMIPLGSIADHIRIDDGLPIYFPGTYDVVDQGNKTFGMFPPYCDQFFFIHMAYEYVKASHDSNILLTYINGIKLIDRLELAFKVPPKEKDRQVVYTTDDYRGVDFGFRDVINMTGNLALPSLLKYKAAIELAELNQQMNRKKNATNFRSIALQLKKEIPTIFSDERGMILASTGRSKQPDVWSTVLAIYYGILDGKQMQKTCSFLRDAYVKGQLTKNGNVRHIITSDDYSESTAWENSLARKNTYQNGAYWGTPVGWLCDAIARVDIDAARMLAKEYIDDLRNGDFRKGPGFGAPWECYNDDGSQNSVYLTTVASPYIVFKKN